MIDVVRAGAQTARSYIRSCWGELQERDATDRAPLSHRIECDSVLHARATYRAMHDQIDPGHHEKPLEGEIRDLSVRFWYADGKPFVHVFWYWVTGLSATS